MSKFNVGDWVFYVLEERAGTVTRIRNGYVGRYLVLFDDNTSRHCSPRDLVLLNRPQSRPSRITVNEKIDLILDYLGLEIDDEVKLVKKENQNEEQ